MLDISEIVQFSELDHYLSAVTSCRTTCWGTRLVNITTSEKHYEDVKLADLESKCYELACSTIVTDNTEYATFNSYHACLHKIRDFQGNGFLESLMALIRRVSRAVFHFFTAPKNCLLNMNFLPVHGFTFFCEHPGEITSALNVIQAGEPLREGLFLQPIEGSQMYQFVTLESFEVSHQFILRKVGTSEGGFQVSIHEGKIYSIQKI